MYWSFFALTSCLLYMLYLKGWLYGDFLHWLKFQLGIPNWKKLQMYEKFQLELKIFQARLEYNSLEKIENLEG